MLSVLGPMILNKEAPSMQVIGRILNGEFPSIPRLGFGGTRISIEVYRCVLTLITVVDVRDVAAAHIAAYVR